MKTYAGIGSRETPQAAIAVIQEFAANMTKGDWTVRTGGASGADEAFAHSVGKIDTDLVEIYLPWAGFNGWHPDEAAMCKPTPEAFKLAAKIHPAWKRLSANARTLHARNCHIILGPYLTDPVEFVICWTARGKDVGGTAQGIRLARREKIPIINLGGSYG
jgi:hypothetical protein